MCPLFFLAQIDGGCAAGVPSVDKPAWIQSSNVPQVFPCGGQFNLPGLCCHFWTILWFFCQFMQRSHRPYFHSSSRYLSHLSCSLAHLLFDFNLFVSIMYVAAVCVLLILVLFFSDEHLRRQRWLKLSLFFSVSLACLYVWSLGDCSYVFEFIYFLSSCFTVVCFVVLSRLRCL